MERERYSLTFSAEVVRGEPGEDAAISLLMHCAMSTRVVKSWEIDSGSAFIFEEKPGQLASFVAGKLREILQ